MDTNQKQLVTFCTKATKVNFYRHLQVSEKYNAYEKDFYSFVYFCNI